MSLISYREKFPEYDDVPDDQLVNALHIKYGEGMDLSAFSEKIGYAPIPEVVPFKPTGPEKEEFSFKRLGKQTGRAIAQGVADVSRALRASEQQFDVSGAARALTDKEHPYLKWLEESGDIDLIPDELQDASAQEIESYLQQDKERNIKAYKDFEKKLPRLLPGSSGIVEDAVTGMARFLPAMGISAVSPTTGFAITYAQIAGSKQDEYEQQGVDPETAYVASNLSALAQTPIEFAGNLLQIGVLKNLGKSILKKAPKGKTVQFITALFKNAAAEGGEEFLQQYPDEIANYYAANPDIEAGELADMVWNNIGQITKSATQAAGVGALGGGILAGAAGAVASPAALSNYKFEKQQKIEEQRQPEPEETPVEPQKEPVEKTFQPTGRPSTAQEAAETFRQAPEVITKPAKESAEVIAQAGDQISRAARERQDIINRTNVEVENEIEANKRAREELKKQATERKTIGQQLDDVIDQLKQQVQPKESKSDQTQEGRVLRDQREKEAERGAVESRGAISEQEGGEEATRAVGVAQKTRIEDLTKEEIDNLSDEERARLVLGEEATPEEVQKLGEQAKKTREELAEKAKKEPWKITSDNIDKKYSMASGTVDGRVVRKEIPNQDSIEATLDNFTILKGIREVPLSDFDAPPEINQKTKKLAQAINESGELNPLIVVLDAEGPYILEGGNRYDALKISNAKSIPAMVVVDEGSFYDATKQALSEGKPVPKEVLAEYPDLQKKPETPKPKQKPREQLTEKVEPKWKETQKKGKIGKTYKLQGKGSVEGEGNKWYPFDKKGELIGEGEIVEPVSTLEEAKRIVEGEKTGRRSAKEPSIKTEQAEKPKAIMVGTGDVFRTKSGREMSPVPMVKVKSNRTAKNTIKRINTWLRDEVIKEAKANNDEFNQLQFEAINVNNISQADQDSMNLYLFDDVEGPKESNRIEKIPEQEKTKPQPIGTAWVGNQWKPILEAKEIKRGKKKGQFRVSLIQKTPSGNQKTVIVPADAVRLSEKTDEIENVGKDKSINIKFKEHYAFQQGMKTGIEDFALGVKDGANKALIKTNYVKKFERDAYINGYNLGYQEKYKKSWRENKNLLFKAVSNKDVNPVDWKISSNINGNFIEQIDASTKEKPSERLEKAVVPKKSEIEVTEKDQTTEVKADIPKKEAESLTPKEQKKYLINEIDAAIKQAPEVAKDITPDNEQQVELDKAQEEFKKLDEIAVSERDKLEEFEKTKPGYSDSDYNTDAWENRQKEYRKKYSELFDKADAASTKRSLSEIRLRNLERRYKKSTVTINVPGDGDFTIINEKQTLKDFKKAANKMPASDIIKGFTPKIATTKESTTSLQRISGEGVEYYNQYTPRKMGLVEDKEHQYYKDGFHSDGKYLIKSEVKPKGPYKTGEEAPDIKDHVSTLRKKKVPAKVVGELNTGVFEPQQQPILADIVNKNGDHALFNIHYIDAILTKYPKSKVYMESGEMEPAVFKIGKEVVGVAMPFDAGGFPEFAKKRYEKLTGTEQPKKEAAAFKEKTGKWEKAPKDFILQKDRESKAFKRKTSKVFETIKSESGESQLVTDLSSVGVDLIKQGHNTYQEFSKQMKSIFSEVWDKIRKLMRKVFNQAKRIIANQRGSLSNSKEDPVVLPPSLENLERSDYVYSGDELIGEIKYLQALELKLRAYDLADPQDNFVEYYRNQTEDEFDEVAEGALEAVKRHYDWWLERHEDGEGWAKQLLDTDGEQGSYSSPSEAFKGGVVGVLDGGNSWQVDVESEVVDKVNEEHGMPPLPEDADEIFNELEDYSIGDLDELKEQFEEGDIDEYDLQQRLQDERYKDYNYADKIYVEDGQQLGEYLDNAGWDSPIGQTILEVMQDEGYKTWRENWGAELTNAEDRIRDQRQALDDAETPGEIMSAISFALNEQHVYGTMADHMDLGQSDLDELSNMADSIKDFKQLLRRNYRPGATKYGAIDPQNIINNVKNQKGEAQILSDLSEFGAGLIRDGHNTYTKFKARMKEVFSEVWDKIKHLMRRAFNQAKQIFKSQKGQLTFQTTPEETTETKLGTDDDPSLVGHFWDEFVFQAQDRFNYLNKEQIKAGQRRRLEGLSEELPEGMDTYLAELRYHGKTGAEIEDLQEAYVEPLIEIISSNKLDIKDVDRFLHARHAQEANTQLQKINPDLKDNEALSGMTNEEAESILAENSGNEALNQIADIVDSITALDRKNRIKYGLEKPETIKQWEKTYQNYVPLMREGKGSKLPAKGRGFDIKGGQRRRAGSRRQVINVLAYTIAQAESTIVRGQKNVVTNALYNFAEANQGPWEVDKVEYKPTFDSQGLVHYRPDSAYRLADNVVSTRINGVDHHITFDQSDHNAVRIAQAMKKLKSGDTGPLVKILSRFTRWLALVNTGLNPEFIISNFLRDIQTAGYNMSDSEAQDIKWKAIGQVGKAWKGIRQFQKGKKGTEWAKWFDRFRKAGAQTGWIESYENIEKRETDLVKKVKQMGKGNYRKFRRGISAMFDYINDHNTAIENGIRLSTFKNLVENGVPEAKAAKIAKELTVNFNRKGNAGQALNALYLFYNASIQGSARVISAAAKSKRVRRLIYSTVVFAAALDVLNRMIGGDDDDGVPRYDKVPDWIKERNLVVMFPSGNYLRIPLPWGYNVFHVMGQGLGEMMTKKGKLADKAGHAGTRLAAATVQAFNPVGGEATLLQLISPTIVRPVVQWAENKDWTGRPLRPDNNPFKPLPESQKYFQSVRAPSRAFTRFLNESTGGSEIRPGKIDISPEAVDLFIDTFTGGAGRFAGDLISTPIKAIKGEEIETYEIPGLRKLYGSQGFTQLSQEFYNNMDTIQLTYNEYRHYRGDRKKLREINEQYGQQRKLFKAMKSAKKKMSELRKKQRALKKRDNEKRLDRVNNQIKRVMKNFNKRYNNIMENEK